jgi:hypothetical protein
MSYRIIVHLNAIRGDTDLGLTVNKDCFGRGLLILNPLTFVFCGRGFVESGVRLLSGWHITKNTLKTV